VLGIFLFQVIFLPKKSPVTLAVTGLIDVASILSTQHGSYGRNRCHSIILDYLNLALLII